MTYSKEQSASSSAPILPRVPVRPRKPHFAPTLTRYARAAVKVSRGINQTRCTRIPTVAVDRSAFVPRYDSQRSTMGDVLIVPPKHSWLVAIAPLSARSAISAHYFVFSTAPVISTGTHNHFCLAPRFSKLQHPRETYILLKYEKKLRRRRH